jgi:hypothetical protein
MKSIDELIDIPLWDQARWKGVLFRTQEGTIPVIALVFTDGTAAEDIFKGWLELLGGDDDVDDVIRLSIIDGEIPGHGPGYTIHIAPDPKRVLEGPAGAASTEANPTIFATRLQRMQNPNPANLAKFKEAFLQSGQCWLVPSILGPSGPLLHPACRIMKRSVLFRTPSDIIDQNDIDRIVLAKPGEAFGATGSESVH